MAATCEAGDRQPAGGLTFRPNPGSVRTEAIPLPSGRIRRRACGCGPAHPVASEGGTKPIAGAGRLKGGDTSVRCAWAPGQVGGLGDGKAGHAVTRAKRSGTYRRCSQCGGVLSARSYPQFPMLAAKHSGPAAFRCRHGAHPHRQQRGPADRGGTLARRWAPDCAEPSPRRATSTQHTRRAQRVVDTFTDS